MFSYTSGNGNPKKNPYIFQEMETLEKFLIFQETELFSQPQEKLLILQEREAPKKFLMFS